MGVSDDRPQREAAQVEPGAFAGDGAGEYRGHPDNWAKQGAAAAPNGGDPDGPAHAPVDKDAPYDMPSIPRAGATDADFAAGTTVERVVGHDEWRALVPEMVRRLRGNQPVCRVRHRHAIEQAVRRWRGG